MRFRILREVNETSYWFRVEKYDSYRTIFGNERGWWAYVATFSTLEQAHQFLNRMKQHREVVWEGEV